MTIYRLPDGAVFRTPRRAGRGRHTLGGLLPALLLVALLLLIWIPLLLVTVIAFTLALAVKVLASVGAYLILITLVVRFVSNRMAARQAAPRAADITPSSSSSFPVPPPAKPLDGR